MDLNPVALVTQVLREETHLAELMSPASHFFFVQKQKNSADKNPFTNVVKKRIWSYFQSRRKNSQTVFTSDSHISPGQQVKCSFVKVILGTR